MGRNKVLFILLFCVVCTTARFIPRFPGFKTFPKLGGVNKEIAGNILSHLMRGEEIVEQRQPDKIPETQIERIIRKNNIKSLNNTLSLLGSVFFHIFAPKGTVTSNTTTLKNQTDSGSISAPSEFKIEFKERRNNCTLREEHLQNNQSNTRSNSSDVSVEHSSESEGHYTSLENSDEDALTSNYDKEQSIENEIHTKKDESVEEILHFKQDLEKYDYKSEESNDLHSNEETHLESDHPYVVTISTEYYSSEDGSKENEAFYSNEIRAEGSEEIAQEYHTSDDTISDHQSTMEHHSSEDRYGKEYYHPDESVYEYDTTKTHYLTAEKNVNEYDTKAESESEYYGTDVSSEYEVYSNENHLRDSDTSSDPEIDTRNRRERRAAKKFKSIKVEKKGAAAPNPEGISPPKNKIARNIFRFGGNQKVESNQGSKTIIPNDPPTKSSSNQLIQKTVKPTVATKLNPSKPALKPTHKPTINSKLKKTSHLGDNHQKMTQTGNAVGSSDRTIRKNRPTNPTNMQQSNLPRTSYAKPIGVESDPLYKTTTQAKYSTRLTTKYNNFTSSISNATNSLTESAKSKAKEVKSKVKKFAAEEIAGMALGGVVSVGGILLTTLRCLLPCITNRRADGGNHFFSRMRPKQPSRFRRMKNWMSMKWSITKRKVQRSSISLAAVLNAVALGTAYFMYTVTPKSEEHYVSEV